MHGIRPDSSKALNDELKTRKKITPLFICHKLLSKSEIYDHSDNLFPFTNRTIESAIMTQKISHFKKRSFKRLFKLK